MLAPLTVISAGFLIGFFAYPYLAKEEEEEIETGSGETGTPSADAEAQTVPSAMRAAEPEVKESVVEPESVESEPAPSTEFSSSEESIDALKSINGIGPTYAKRLFEGGIRSIAAVAASTPDALATLTKVGPSRKPGPADWIAEAKTLIK
ncbi:MAG: helix-hairpin-helix domain-containing protein [Chloroflexota bacterium]